MPSQSLSKPYPAVNDGAIDSEDAESLVNKAKIHLGFYCVIRVKLPPTKAGGNLKEAAFSDSLFKRSRCHVFKRRTKTYKALSRSTLTVM